MPIPYHSEISTIDLLKGEQYRKLRPLLRDNVVIYSSQVAPRKDFVISPIHGNIDGAFIHAMALDNLLTFGNQYIRQAPEGFLHKSFPELQPVLVMLGFSLLVVGYRFWLLRSSRKDYTVQGLHDADEHFFKWVVRSLYFMIPLTGLIEFFVWRIAPFNWLGLMVILHMAHRMDKWFFETVRRKQKEDHTI
jgi:hypothetical protein